PARHEDGRRSALPSVQDKRRPRSDLGICLPRWRWAGAGPPGLHGVTANSTAEREEEEPGEEEDDKRRRRAELKRSSTSLGHRRGSEERQRAATCYLARLCAVAPPVPEFHQGEGMRRGREFLVREARSQKTQTAKHAKTLYWRARLEPILYKTKWRYQTWMAGCAVLRQSS
ncbi:unnamed protein product, partial [Prorocentrum cordatum]